MGKSKVNAIVSCRCPRCREGKVFTHSPLNVGKVLNIHEHCPTCGFKFEVEPGFFWAAMYISYAINVATVVVIFLAINILTGSRDPIHYLVPIISALLISFPFILRYSRIILLHFFSGVKYQNKTEWS